MNAASSLLLETLLSGLKEVNIWTDEDNFIWTDEDNFIWTDEDGFIWNNECVCIWTVEDGFVWTDLRAFYLEC
jgi:hypothetical protein